MLSLRALRTRALAAWIVALASVACGACGSSSPEVESSPSAPPPAETSSPAPAPRAGPLPDVPLEPLAPDAVPDWLRSPDTEEPLPEGAVERLGSLRYRVIDPKLNVQLRFADDKLLLLQRVRYRPVLRDVVRGEQLRTFDLPKVSGPAIPLSVSADDRVVAAGCARVSVQVEDTAAYKWRSPNERRPAPGTGVMMAPRHYEQTCVGFDRPAQHALVVFEDGAVQLFELGGGSVLHTYEDTGCRSAGVALGPDAERFACTTREGASLFARDGEPIGEVGLEGGATAVALSADGRFGAVGGEGEVALFDVASGSVRARVRSRPGLTIDALAISSDARWVATAARGRIDVWQAQSGRPVPVPAGHDDHVRHVVVSADGERITSGADDGRVLVWDRSGHVQRELPSPGHRIAALARSADGSALAVLDHDVEAQRRAVRVHREADGELLHAVPDVAGHKESLALAPDGSFLLIGGGYLQSEALGDGVSPPRFRTGDVNPERIALSPNGEILVLGHRMSPTVVTLTRPGYRPLALRVPRPKPRRNAFSMAGAFGRGSRRPAPTDEHESGLAAITFRADGEQIATASRGGTIHLWKPDGSHVGCYPGKARALAYHPSGRLVAAIGSGDVRVQPAQPGTLGRRGCDAGEPLVLEGHLGAATGVAVTPDGEHIVTSSEDGTLLVWMWPA